MPKIRITGTPQMQIGGNLLSSNMPIFNFNQPYQGGYPPMQQPYMGVNHQQQQQRSFAAPGEQPMDTDSANALRQLECQGTGGKVGTRRIKIIGTPQMEMAAGGSTGYGMQMPGGSYALDRRTTQMGSMAGTPKVNPYSKVGTTLPEAPPGKGNIKIEKKEIALGDFDQDGKQETLNANTGSHASGNDSEVALPPASFVFSDTRDLRIKDPNIQKQFGMALSKKGYTPAKIAAKYDLNKFKTNPTDDPIAKKTKEFVSDNFLKKLNDLAAVQESMKKQMGMDHHEPNQGVAKYGGHLKEYAKGGKNTPNFTGNETPVKPIDYMDWDAFQRTGIPEDNGFNTETYPQNVGAYQDYMNQLITDHPSDVINRKGAFADPLNRDGKIGIDTYGLRYNPSVPAIQQPPKQPDFYSGTNFNLPTTGYTNIPQSPIYMHHIPAPQSPDIPQPPNTKVPREPWDMFRVGPNFDGYVQNLFARKELSRFQPYAPVPQMVLPDTVFADPTRKIAEGQEIARSAMENANLSSNGQGSRANVLAYQGEAGKQAANTDSDYNFHNVGIANSANQFAAQQTNQLLKEKGDRLAELNKQGFLADRDYQKQLHDLQKEGILRQQEIMKTNSERSAFNTQSPYRKIDNYGIFHFQPGAAQANYWNQLPGGGQNSHRTMAQIKSDYIASGGNPNKADDFADDMYREQQGLRNRRVETQQPGKLPNEKTTVYGNPYKFGGLSQMAKGGRVDLYDRSKLAKFMR